CVRQEGYVEGKAEGKAESLLEILEELGTITDDLRERIQRETSLEQLKQWIKTAAKVENLEEFINKM
ncbi:MAG: hypothetical protein IJN16_04355, partial [Lachnospiraceae bacterium]|nr:hypothetical protein [Lachnospiraceae bacterium]